MFFTKQQLIYGGIGLGVIAVGLGVVATNKKKTANNAAIEQLDTTVQGESLEKIAEAVHNITMSSVSCSAFGQGADYWVAIIGQMTQSQIAQLKTVWLNNWQDKNIGAYAQFANSWLGLGGYGRTMYEAIYQLVCSLPNSVDCLTCSVQNAALQKLK